MIHDMLFADAALAATSYAEAQELVNRSPEVSKAFGLTISIKKTEVVHQPHPNPRQVKGVRQQAPAHSFPENCITVDGKNLKYVKGFTYFGSTVKSKAFIDVEIVNRIARVTESFGRIQQRLWNNRGIKLETETRVYKAVVLTTLLYGAETWTP